MNVESAASQPLAPFEFYGVARVVFGRGQFSRAGELAASLGRTAMVIYNGSSPIADLSQMLQAAGLSCWPRRQKGEPIAADVDAATAEAKKFGCNMVIGLGGGSAIDAAKAVAGLLANGGSAIDYMEVVGKGLKITRPALPWIAIPTTAGTGAEATRNAVIGLPEKRFKASIRGDMLLPRIALIDPQLGVNVPPDVTARSGMDALCQCIESYTSIGANPITDSLALEGVRRAVRSLRQAYDNGADLDAREDMAMAALLSGMALTSAGLGAVHGFAAPLGANFPAPHGAICGALLPWIMRANIRALREQPGEASRRTLKRYGIIGRLLASNDHLGMEEAMDAAVQVVADVGAALNLPRLADFGVKEADTGEMISLARKSSSMRFNPVALSDEALASALTGAIRGGFRTS